MRYSEAAAPTAANYFIPGDNGAGIGILMASAQRAKEIQDKKDKEKKAASTVRSSLASNFAPVDPVTIRDTQLNELKGQYQKKFIDISATINDENKLYEEYSKLNNEMYSKMTGFARQTEKYKAVTAELGQLGPNFNKEQAKAIIDQRFSEGLLSKGADYNFEDVELAFVARDSFMADQYLNEYMKAMGTKSGSSLANIGGLVVLETGFGEFVDENGEFDQSKVRLAAQNLVDEPQNGEFLKASMMRRAGEEGAKMTPAEQRDFAIAETEKELFRRVNYKKSTSQLSYPKETEGVRKTRENLNLRYPLVEAVANKINGLPVDEEMVQTALNAIVGSNVTLDKQGKKNVSVRTISITTEKPPIEEMQGEAVSKWFGPNQYKIIHKGVEYVGSSKEDAYSKIPGDPNKNVLMINGRQQDIEPDHLRAMINSAMNKGFETDVPWTRYQEYAKKRATEAINEN